MPWLGLLLAVLVGIALGLLGGGGSILTVPIFVYVLGVDAKSAIGMSLAVVGATSLFGAASHWRSGRVSLRVAAVFGAVAMAGTYLGARLAVLLAGTTQLAIFAVVMLVAAAFMFRGRAADSETGATDGLVLPIVPLASVGLATGLLTGLVGIGGGFVIVPALVLLGRVPMKQAVGTSLVIIALNAFAGLLGYMGQVEFEWPLVAGFTALAIVGSLIGVRLVRYVSPGVLRRGFAAFLVVMGVFILAQNLGRGWSV